MANNIIKYSSASKLPEVTGDWDSGVHLTRFTPQLSSSQHTWSDGTGYLTASSDFTSIGKITFYGSSITGITIPNSVTSIGDSAFCDCTSLTEITIPDSVTSIGYACCYGCTSLSSVNIPNSVTYIGSCTFYNCLNLTSVTLGTGLTSIGDSAFCDCTSLTEITIPDSVTSICDIAFRGCTSLTSVTINAANPPTLGTGVFKYYNSSWQYKILPNLHIYVPAESLYLYKTATNWSEYADRIFPNGDTPTATPTVTPTGTPTPTIQPETITLRQYILNNVIPNEQGKITGQILQNCLTNLYDYGKSICGRDYYYTGPSTIPDNVIRYTAASKLPEVTGIWDSGVHLSYFAPSLTSSQHKFNNGTGELTATSYFSIIGENAFYGSSITGIIIPNKVTSIGACAFGWCDGLQSVTLGTGLTSIGDSAFCDCSSLTSITIPDSVINIGYSFPYCTSLQTVTIGSGIRYIESHSFYDCMSLSSVTVNAVNPPNLGNEVFHNTNNCPIYVPAESLYLYKTSTNWVEYADRIFPNGDTPTGTPTATPTGTTAAPTSIAPTTTSAPTTTAAPAVPELVDLGLSVKWAKTNVGATTESGYGNLYQWGSTVDNSNTVCDWAHAPFNNGSSDFDQAYFDTVKDTVCPNGVLASQYDVATQTYGTGYRMPTKAEFNELINNTTSSWTTKDGINGRLFTGNNGNSIFIPAAGDRWYSSTGGIGSSARVWSASLYTDFESNAWRLLFGSDSIGTGTNDRYDGMSVRSVS